MVIIKQTWSTLVLLDLRLCFTGFCMRESVVNDLNCWQKVHICLLQPHPSIGNISCIKRSINTGNCFEAYMVCTKAILQSQYPLHHPHSRSSPNHSFIEVCNRKAEAAANSDWLTIVARVHKLFHVILTECWELKQAFIEVPKFKLFVKHTEIPSKPFILFESDLNSAFLTVLCIAIIVIAMATFSTGIDSKCFQVCFSCISMDFFLG